MNLDELRRSVLAQIDSYRDALPEHALGRPFPEEKAAGLLTQMRDSLVTPEWRVVAIRDLPDGTQLDPPVDRLCALVADDRNGFELSYDLDEDAYFLADGRGSINVGGDAVGCFMAR